MIQFQARGCTDLLEPPFVWGSNCFVGFFCFVLCFFLNSTFKVSQRVTQRWLQIFVPYCWLTFIAQEEDTENMNLSICLCRHFPIRSGNSRICPKRIYLAIPLLLIPLNNPAWDQLKRVTAPNFHSDPAKAAIRSLKWIIFKYLTWQWTLWIAHEFLKVSNKHSA